MDLREYAGDHNYTDREITVVNVLFDNRHLNIKSFLNVGFRKWDDPRNHWWMKLCDRNNIDWSIMEIFQPNVDDAISHGCPSEKIFRGDIMDVEAYSNYDCILFWHGPEHVEKNIFIDNLKHIEQRANKIIILGMPLGKHPQRAVYGNKHEKHISSWGIKDWNKLNYFVIPVYDNKKYPHITTYKIFK